LYKNEEKKVNDWLIADKGVFFNHLTLFSVKPSFKKNLPLKSFEKKNYDAWATSDVLDSFSFFRSSSVTLFFANAMVDLPLCFKKSKSLFSKSFEIPLLRLINFLTVHGKRNLAWKSFTQALFIFLKKWILLNSDKDFFLSWNFLYSVTKSYFFKPKTLGNSFFLKNAPTLELGNFLFKKNKFFSTKYYLNTYLLDSLKGFDPIFTFFIKKNDKMKRKHARGKIDKLKLMWKYVPFYKRLYQTIRWLFKDLKFQKFKFLHLRLLDVIETFLLNPDLSFLFRIKSFVHNFVFQKFKSTLLKTLKTVA